MRKQFKNLKTKSVLQLQVSPKTGQIFYLNQWWDALFLKRVFSIVEMPEVIQLGSEVLPPFGDPAQYQGEFKYSVRKYRPKK